MRPFVKFDALPRSVPDALAAITSALETAVAEPAGPTYVCIETPLQEAALVSGLTTPIGRIDEARAFEPDPVDVAEAARLLRAAERPVILAGRVDRDRDGWERRVLLAERLGARVITDLKTGAAFPTEHPLHVPGSGYFPSAEARTIFGSADVVLSLDWIDPVGTLSLAPEGATDAGSVRILIEAGPTAGASDRGSDALFARAHSDVALTAGTDVIVERLLEMISGDLSPVVVERAPGFATSTLDSDGSGALALADVSRVVRAATAEEAVCLLRVPIGWDSRTWPFRDPLDYIGYDGGAGIGSGPGMAVGAALALRGSNRLPVAVLGDGDLLMGMGALWTAAHHRIPLLILVANNRSYLSDVAQQERIARQRGRDPGRKWIGQRIDDPAVDLAALTRAQGFDAWGPITTVADLDAVLPEALAAVRSRRSALSDVVIATVD